MTVKTDTSAVKVLLDYIDAHPEIFEGLEDKKITPALIAYQCVCMQSLADTFKEFTNAMKNILKRIDVKASKIFFQEGKDGS